MRLLGGVVDKVLGREKTASTKSHKKKDPDPKAGKHKLTQLAVIFEKQVTVDVMLNTPTIRNPTCHGKDKNYNIKNVLCRTSTVRARDRVKMNDGGKSLPRSRRYAEITYTSPQDRMAKPQPR